MTMKKILKEWKTFQQLNEANYGEFNKLGIDIFLRNFADSHNAEEFLEKKVKNVESRKDVAYRGQGAGLGGLMDDWFLGRNAFTVFREQMLRAVNRLAKNHPEVIEKHGKIEFSPQDQAPLPDLPTEPVSQRAKDLEAFFAKYGGK